MLAALPDWLQGNVSIGALIVLAIVAATVIRLVRKMATRVALVVFLVAAGMAVYVQEDEIERCGSTCRCELFSLDVKVPFCSREFPGE